jgi:hypothetical protein
MLKIETVQGFEVFTAVGYEEYYLLGYNAV